MNRFCAALRFLTFIPIPGPWGTDPAHLAGCVVFFPLVGLAIGAAAGLGCWGLNRFFPVWPGAVLAVLLLIGLSGGLHLDGLSDTADGFLSARPRERMLEIMRDSHVGAMGVMAVVGVMSLKMAALASVPGGGMWRAVFLMPVAGRVAMMTNMSLLSYARPEGGLGTLFFEHRSRWNTVWGVAVLLVAGWCVAGRAGLISAAAAILVGLAFAGYCFKKINGATGDTLGAVCELGEAAVGLALTAVPLEWMR